MAFEGLHISGLETLEPHPTPKRFGTFFIFTDDKLPCGRVLHTCTGGQDKCRVNWRRGDSASSFAASKRPGWSGARFSVQLGWRGDGTFSQGLPLQIARFALNGACGRPAGVFSAQRIWTGVKRIANWQR
ncbi:hypothetical protein GN956_G21264 [Arapaima gigas]